MREKHIEEGLHHKHLRGIPIKYHSNHRKHKYELKRQKPRNNKLDVSLYEFILPKKTENILRAISEISRHIKQSIKKTLLNKISTRLLGLKFK